MRTTNSALSLALILALSACSGSDTATTTAATTPTTTATTQAPATTAVPAATLTISGFAFGEAPAIAVGQVLTIQNNDGATHTWTSNDGVFDSGNISSGTSFTFTFDTPGEYAFHCTIHGSMSGTITVSG